MKTRGQSGTEPRAVTTLKTVIVLGVVSVSTPLRAAEPAEAGPVLSAIGQLEAKSDPKCYATAARLEDFMFGTPLSDEARFLKNRLLKHFVTQVWQAAAGDSPDAVSAAAIVKAGAGYLKSGAKPDGSRGVNFGGGTAVEISARDLRQYGSVAYSLRAILAAQQDNFLAGNPLPRLGGPALGELQQLADEVGLAVLQEADGAARAAGARAVEAGHIEGAWGRLFAAGAMRPEVPPIAAAGAQPAGGQPLLREIIDQKRASYAAYNQIANQLFVRNLQVYFARLSWPKDPADAAAFRRAYTETVIAFAGDLYRAAAADALARNSPTVGERDVASAGQKFLPHRVNEYEDVVFFPKLGRERRVVIEAYDFDAFRDSGIHWHYVGQALDDLGEAKLPDADPFGAELLAEHVAQFGVLVLRMAGEAGGRRDQERVSLALLGEGMRELQAAITANAAAPDRPEPEAGIASVAGTGGAALGTLFAESTAGSGVDFMHRSSDWLNRLLRGYLRKDEGAGTITIPPAFGGSGAAAEDINGDGKPDLLLLGGLGNRLYLGLGDGRFEDITERSGIAFRRASDNLPGEPRQALIADFDNDGQQDIFISYVDDDHRLYKGRGDGTFGDVTASAGLGGKGLVGGPATTFDYDGDGLLDIYITYFGDYIHGVLPTLKRENDNGLPNRLWRNLGGMRFADVTQKAGVGDTGWGQAASHTDFDGDGRQDLIAGNDFGVNRYYRNRGDGTFEEVSAALGTDKPSYTMSISVADLNRDLLPDIYISNIVTMNKDEKYVLPGADTRMKFDLAKLAQLRVVEANDLFLSSRAADRGVVYALSNAVERGYSSTGWAWDADFFDADLDGDDDLYVLNGMNEFNIYSSRDPYFMEPDKLSNGEIFVPVAPREANVFLENRGGKLRVPAEPSGLGFEGNSRSAVYLDWDADGDLDVCVNGFNERARLFRNLAEPGKRWIKIRLVGDPARGINRDAIGAKVVLHLPGGGTVWREVHGGTGYMSSHPKQVHAGLGDAAVVDAEITWPDGGVQKVPGLAAGRTHTVQYQSFAAK